MEVILHTTDHTQIPFVKMLLSLMDIEAFVFNQNMFELEGLINILSISIMVLASDSLASRSILYQNGISTL